MIDFRHRKDLEVMRNLVHSLRFKLLVGALVGGMVFTALFGRVLDTYVRQSFAHEFYEHAMRATSKVVDLAKKEGSADSAGLNAVLDRAKVSDSEGSILRIHLHAKRGNRVVTVASTKRAEIGKAASAADARAFAGRRLTMIEEPEQLLEIHRPVMLAGGDKVALGVYFSTAERDRRIAALNRSTIPLRFGMLAVLLITIMLAGEYFVFRPIRRLRTAAERIAAGDVDSELAVSSADEIGGLAKSLDGMRLSLITYAGNLEQRLRELTLLYNISQVTNAATDLDDALQVILESAAKALGATRGVAYIVSRSAKKRDQGLVPRASYGFESDTPELTLMESADGIVQRVLESGTPLAVAEGSDVDLVAVPIIVSGEVVGVLMASGKQEGRFSDSDSQLLLTLANQASGVINSSRLFEDLQSSYLSTVQALAAAIDAKDKYTRGHSGRVVKYSELIAKEMGCSSDDIEAVKIAAYLHDLGKIGVDERVLLKPDALSDEDIVHIREHPTISADIVGRVNFLEHVVPLVKHHHERFDGSGYPTGLKGDDIPLGARILAVADSFDAMTSDRPYRQALTTKAAVDELVGGMGTQFDPTVVSAFLILAHIEVPEPEQEWRQAFMER